MQSSLNSRIKEKRIECNLSQSDFAIAVGVSQPTVANWENGSHTPRPLALIEISRVLKVEQAWLLSGTTSIEMSPATPYLDTPTRHIPIYNWPSDLSTISPENRIGYIPLATGKTGLVAFQEKDPKTGVSTLSILDFSKNHVSNTRAGLIQKNGQLKLVQNMKKVLKENRMARLHATFILYPESTIGNQPPFNDA